MCNFTDLGNRSTLHCGSCKTRVECIVWTNLYDMTGTV